MSDLKAQLDRELAAVVPTKDARTAIDRRVARRRRRRTVLLPTATLILTAGLVAGLTYAFSPDPAGTRDEKPGISLPVNQIAFTSYRDGRLMDIYLMNTDGTGAIRLTDSGAEDLLPAWSPDGSKIAFSSTRSVGPPHIDGHIFMMNADGTGQRRLVFDLSSAGSPAWSPDGAKIAFAGCCRPGWDIYVINEDGTGLVQLTSDELFDSSPGWSPDGSRIVFGRDDDGTGPKLPSHGLYLMSADGTGLRQLTHGYGAQPAWSPASTGIAFTRFGDRRGIYVIDPRSGEEVRLTSEEDTEPAWSPDGARIAFTSYRVNGEGDIFVMESDGSHQIQITVNPFGDYEPAWQPARAVSPEQIDPGRRAAPAASFVPPTRLEGDRAVMPVVFPDGSTAEITYPSELRLAELGVSPNILANHPGECGSDPVITRAGQHGEIYEGDAPLATFDGHTGPVELWEGAAGWQPLYLVFRFGPWWFHMPCQGPADLVEETGAQWAQRLSGRVTETGFLVLSAEPPLELVGPDSGPLFGPELYLDGGRDAPGFVLLALGRACPVGADEDREPGYARRCMEVDDGALQITVQVAVAPEQVTEEGREFVRSVIEEVRVRSLDTA